MLVLVDVYMAHRCWMFALCTSGHVCACMENRVVSIKIPYSTQNLLHPPARNRCRASRSNDFLQKTPYRFKSSPIRSLDSEIKRSGFLAALPGRRPSLSALDGLGLRLCRTPPSAPAALRLGLRRSRPPPRPCSSSRWPALGVRRTSLAAPPPFLEPLPSRWPPSRANRRPPALELAPSITDLDSPFPSPRSSSCWPCPRLYFLHGLAPPASSSSSSTAKSYSFPIVASTLFLRSSLKSIR
jgi:hypothetical protein